MSTPKDRGFPQDFPDLGISSDGISKLNYFAAAISSAVVQFRAYGGSADSIAKDAFDIAEAMITEAAKRAASQVVGKFGAWVSNGECGNVVERIAEPVQQALDAETAPLRWQLVGKDAEIEQLKTRLLSAETKLDSYMLAYPAEKVDRAFADLKLAKEALSLLCANHQIHCLDCGANLRLGAKHGRHCLGGQALAAINALEGGDANAPVPPTAGDITAAPTSDPEAGDARPMIYLAVPYTHPDPSVREARFHAVNMAAAKLEQAGNHVFSPISHTHPIALCGDLPTGWDYWESYDERMISICTKLTVLKLDGWDKSIGVTAEIKIAQRFGLEVDYIEPESEAQQ